MEGYHLKYQGVDGRMEYKWTLELLARWVFSGFTWLSLSTFGGLLCML
jgi:hypothetical protein